MGKTDIFQNKQKAAIKEVLFTRLLTTPYFTETDKRLLMLPTVLLHTSHSHLRTQILAHPLKIPCVRIAAILCIVTVFRSANHLFTSLFYTY